MNDFKRSHLGWIVLGMAALASAAAAGTDALSSAEECKATRQEAFELRDGYSPAQPGSSLAPSFKKMARAAEICRLAAEKAEDPAEAAELLALSYLSRAFDTSGSLDADARRHLLTEGIHKVQNLHHDRSPALFDLLRKSAFAEGGERGIELLTLALEIGRREFAANDPRQARALSELAFLYAPGTLPGSRPEPADDAVRAEDLYRQAYLIYLKQDDPYAYEGFGDTVAGLRTLMEKTGNSPQTDIMAGHLERFLEKQAGHSARP